MKKIVLTQIHNREIFLLKESQSNRSTVGVKNCVAYVKSKLKENALSLLYNIRSQPCISWKNIEFIMNNDIIRTKYIKCERIALIVTMENIQRKIYNYFPQDALSLALDNRNHVWSS